MTNEELIATIRNKIEGQFSVFLNLLNASQEYGYHKALEFVLSVLSDLEKSMPKVTNSDGQEEENVPKDLEEAADEYEKKHTYQRYDGGGLTPEYDATLAEAFIDGYKFHADHTPLLEDTVLFNKGVEEGKRLMMEEEVNERWDELQTNFREINEAFEVGKKEQREQMMKDAVEGVITNAGGVFGYDVAVFRLDDNHTYSVLLSHEEKRKYGDKVRIIIVKEDEK